MRANELKIGNYLQLQDEVKQISGITKGGFYFGEHGYCVNISELWNPIQLTEEWLLIFGFKKLKSYEYELNHINLINVGCEFEFTGWRKKPVRINFVHELQNLYFILTDEELTV